MWPGSQEADVGARLDAYSALARDATPPHDLDASIVSWMLDAVGVGN